MAWVPKSVNDFAFLCLTSFIGFIIVFLVFINELFRIDSKHIKQSMLLSVETFIFNLFVLLGSKGVAATTISCVLSSYFVFIPIIEFILFKSKPQRSTVVAIVIVLIGVFFMMDCKVETLMTKNVLFLIVADISFAIYLITSGRYAVGSNPSILAMGQLFFNFIIALICWAVVNGITGEKFYLPSEPAFWGGVIFISFFIRAFYGVIQIYAQRFVSPLNTSLIFSTEIIMTMLLSNIVAKYFGMIVPDESISTYRGIGAIVMVAGILIADPGVVKKFKDRGIKGFNGLKVLKKNDK